MSISRVLFAFFWVAINAGMIGYVLGVSASGREINAAALVALCAVFALVVAMNVAVLRRCAGAS